MPLIELVDDLVDAVARRIADEEIPALEALHAPLKRRQRPGARRRVLLDLLNVVRVELEQPLDPALAPLFAQRIGGIDHRVGQVHGRAQHVDVFRLDLVVAELDLEIGAASCAARRLGVERADADLVGEQLLQPFGARAALVDDFPAVIVVHVEDQADRLLARDHAGDDQARQEALARAALAEDADRALDQPLEVRG